MAAGIASRYKTGKRTETYALTVNKDNNPDPLPNTPKPISGSAPLY